MTPRQADVAFVLESIEGVRALYRIEPGSRAAAHCDFAVELERSERIVAAVHYALLRVLTHDECARVFLVREGAPNVIAESARILRLTDSEREAARRRLPQAPAPEPIAAASYQPPPTVLVVDDDLAVASVVWKVHSNPVARHSCVVLPQVDEAARFAETQGCHLILCDARRAFGVDGLLAKLPLDSARRVLVLAHPEDVASARWRLQGTDRILTKPIEPWVLRERLDRVGAMHLSSVPDTARVAGPAPTRGRLEAPPKTAPFSVLLVDADDDLHQALRSIFHADARHLMRHDPKDAAEVALSKPLHAILCSAKAALHPQGGFIDTIAAEDPAGAERILVVAPSRDVSYVRHKLAQKGRRNTVLALPIDEALLRREVFRDHPELVARMAVADVAAAEPQKVAPPRFRRLGVLVVDDDQTTQILFAAADPQAKADVALATSAMEAFEHVTTRAVDLLVVSATMRGDGGEPFYRVLWRLKPELKSRCVLVTPPDAVPASIPPSMPPRVLERPLTRDAIARVVDAFALTR